ncbi:MAG TPA: archaetidylserine decarboxylase [Opitutaceae bacterium]|nr:archaetidylserine decarboxylase [Opitutaceae bacterium]
MPPEPIRYFDRYDRTTKIEKIFGERWLRLAYDNPVGRLAVWLFVSRPLFSLYYGRRMNQRGSDLKILGFIVAYDINVSEFTKSPFDYATFNQFFHRALKPECRPIAAGAAVAALPADGRHLAFPDVDKAGGFYVKGSKFTLEELLGDAGLSARFAGGSMLISRLCPSDYHRFHFPVSGVPSEARLVRGRLYSVSPVALRRNILYLVRNKRFVTLIESQEFGTVAMIEVGATNVGSIVQGFLPGRPVLKGDEKGMFSFGGSCVITLFERNRITLDPDIVEQSAACIETYARMGDRFGIAPS